jgi:uncharacterized Zn-finger protein
VSPIFRNQRDRKKERDGWAPTINSDEKERKASCCDRHIIFVINRRVTTSKTKMLSSSSIHFEKENIPLCKFCQKSFANYSNLRHHIQIIHLKENKWDCNKCGKVKFSFYFSDFFLLLF